MEKKYIIMEAQRNLSKGEQIKKSYQYLCSIEKQRKCINTKEMAKETTWAESTVKTYITKKWSSFIQKNGEDRYIKGICDITLEEYVELMSQKDKFDKDFKKPSLSIEIERHLLKARQSALLALDIYNRPSTVFKTEGFIVMLVIAWTSLFHAIFEKKKTDYFYKEVDGSFKVIDGDRKAWELSTCLSEYYGSSNNAVRNNLDFLIKLRNCIEHRYAPDIDLYVIGECQAALLNFDEIMVKEFSSYFAIKDMLSIPLQTANIRTEKQALALKKLQEKQYKELKDFVDKYRTSLDDNIYNDERFSFRVFLVEKVGNHKSSSDMSIEFIKSDPKRPELTEEIQKNIALIKEKRVPVANKGNLRPKAVVEEVSKRIGRDFKIHNHTSAWKLYNVRKSEKMAQGCDPKYCQFDEAFGDYIYTQEWVEFLVLKLASEDEYNKLCSYRANKQTM